MTFFGALGTVLVTWRGGMLVIDGSITLGELGRLSLLFDAVL
jgi:ABC-type bacteriocin/lantibiotic exporter with double-glycine peptidase domain